jgi:hypothetical protein
VNAKNGYRGYTGRQRFMVAGSNVSIDNQPTLNAKFAGILKQFCDSP